MVIARKDVRALKTISNNHEITMIMLITQADNARLIN